MSVTIEEIAALDTGQVRALIPPLLMDHVEAPPEVHAAVARSLTDALDATTDAELQATLALFRGAGEAWATIFPAAEAARRLAHAYVRPLALTPTVRGVEHLEGALAAGPCLLVCNHQSYCDAQLADFLLPEDLSRRLLFVAGPKVYDEPFRRLAAISFATLKTAQSARLAHNEASLSPRDVARITRRTLQVAAAAMGEGRLVVLYPEGGRTRTGRLAPFLRGASRYGRGAQIVPLALWGTGELLRRGSPMLRPAAVELTVCPPVADLEAAWHAIAAALPEGGRPDGGTQPFA